MFYVGHDTIITQRPFREDRIILACPCGMRRVWKRGKHVCLLPSSCVESPASSLSLRGSGYWWLPFKHCIDIRSSLVQAHGTRKLCWVMLGKIDAHESAKAPLVFSAIGGCKCLFPEAWRAHVWSDWKQQLQTKISCNSTLTSFLFSGAQGCDILLRGRTSSDIVEQS